MKTKHNCGKVVPLRLVPPPAKWVSTATVEMVEDLYRMAQRGELEGVIYVAMKKGGPSQNEYGWAGEAGRNPATALMSLERLKDEIFAYARLKGRI